MKNLFRKSAPEAREQDSYAQAETQAQPQDMHGLFHLETSLYRFNDLFPFTIRDACEGVHIFGGIGSGKSSGSGAHLARAYLQHGFGGLVLCAKKDEVDTWRSYAAAAGRSDDLMIMDASGYYRFPFLQYEISRKGAGAGYTSNLVRLFMTVYEAISRSKTTGGSDPYWQRAMEQLLRNAIDLCVLTTGQVSIPDLYDIISSAPKTPEEVESPEWAENSICWKHIELGHTLFDDMDQFVQYDFESTASFWTNEFPNLDPKTRSGIISTFTSMADNLLRRPFRMLFSEKPPAAEQYFIPEHTHRGIIQIINLPVKEFGDAGRAAQIIYKFMWQQAAERRNIAENPRPIFLWIDESQNFVSEYDMQFQATARSSRACTVYLTQNIPNYYAEMGGKDSKSRVDSLIGNMQTRIWHANADPETNNQAAETIGKSWQTRKGSSQSIGGNDASIGSSSQESLDFDVIPQRFTQLKRGGPMNDRIVEGILFQNGKEWPPTGDPYTDLGKNALLATFKQF